MKQSKTEIYLHFVWAAHDRLPLVTPEREQAVYACILQEAHGLDCTVLALGGIPDHVHLVVEMPAKHAPAYLMQRIKGVSSTFARQKLAQGDFFGWQSGYAAFSVSRSHLKAVVSYVQNQKRRHAAGKLWLEWEETYIETDEVETVSG